MATLATQATMTSSSTRGYEDETGPAAPVASQATESEIASDDTVLLPGDADDLAASIGSLKDIDDHRGASCYWDLSSMAPLNARSAAAVARLRAFRPPPFAVWDRLPLSRRAAVLVLLYADRRGDLRVVLTMRAASLRNYSGHAAFPGGKADTLDETPEQIARREAWEEIGLPLDDDSRPRRFRIEHLCSLPYNLAKTELAVRPCVALLSAAESSAEAAAGGAADIEASLVPRLDAKEVAAVFSAPFHNFLLDTDEAVVDADGQSSTRRLPAGPWYEGSWIHWHEKPWRMHFFYVPVAGQRVAKPKPPAKSSEDGSEDDMEETPGRYKVWGMTARILVDAAQLAYGEKPTFEHNTYFGDERVLEGLERLGRLGDKKKPGSEPTHEDTEDTEAKEASKI